MASGKVERRKGGVVTEPKAPPAKRDLDMNRERLVFCLTSLVGHRVTAKLRHNVIYEGVFHSCSLDGDFSITLKSAQVLPYDGGRSSEVISTLVIPGKDFLQVTATNIPSSGEPEADSPAAGFVTDSEIVLKKASGSERELMTWAPAEDDVRNPAANGALANTSRDKHWDQFTANEHLYGVASTYSEELYTTKLDPNAIPREKREEAERIAREIEAGTMHAEVDGKMERDHDGDEEAAFSSVPRRPLAGQLAITGLPSASGSVPLTEEHLYRHDRAGLAEIPEGFAREHRTKRGMITAHSPMRSPMITEMKRINALNLEPALPKLDDKTRNDWINFKQSQSRSNSKAIQGNGLKHEFQQSLELLNKREAALKLRAQGASEASASSASQGPAAYGRSKNYPEGGEKSSFAFNPAAKEFNFNPSASTFTPGGGGGMQQGGGSPNAGSMQQAMPPPGPQPTFHIGAETALAKTSLDSLLDTLYNRTKGSSPAAAPPVWPEAVGPSFREVLGHPSSQHIMPPTAALMGAQGGPGAWQQQQQASQMGGPHGGGPPCQMQPGGPMVPQGFMVAGPGPGGQPQMYQMGYPGCQRMQGGMNMPQQQGQPMVGYQQAMVQQQPGGGMAMPGGMGSPNSGMPVPKFGGQMVPMTMGQFSPQGQMIQQGQMCMQTQWGQPQHDGRQQMRGGGGMDG